jgi:hypothetical protein
MTYSLWTRADEERPNVEFGLEGKVVLGKMELSRRENSGNSGPRAGARRVRYFSMISFFDPVTPEGVSSL